SHFYCIFDSSFCENILPVADDVLCLRCTCAYESRNSILIAVSQKLNSSFSLYLSSMFSLFPVLLTYPLPLSPISLLSPIPPPSIRSLSSSS
ncbi:hypothetical protein GBAR_LOCUS25275, partial [Geodia barretti]